MITREAATRSLALLLSRMETRIVHPEVLNTEFESDLPRAEIVRLALASQRRHLPLVLDMTPEALELVYQTDFG